MPHVIFLDTEFSSLNRPCLLSLGMVSLQGAREFYAELDLQSEAGLHTARQASDFVRGADVLGQWGRIPGASVDLEQMCERTEQWLSDELTRAQDGGASQLAVCSDYDVDFRLLVQLLRRGRMWDRIRNHLRYQDIYTLMSYAQADEAEEKCFEKLAKTRGLRRHHALADALAMRQGFMALQRD